MQTQSGIVHSMGTDALADVVERILDRGLVIAADIRVNLVDIELLTINLRLLVASVEKAKEMGIDWWEYNPFLVSREKQRGKRLENKDREIASLRKRVAKLEAIAKPQP